MQYGKKLQYLWQLDKSIIFLNHGSFGATPKLILANQYNWNLKIESQPVEFFTDKYPKLIREALAILADFVGANAEDMTFVENATTGVNTVIRSLLPELMQGGEITITNHTYPAVKNIARYISSITKCNINEIEIPVPVTSSEQIIDVISKNLSDKTKIAIFDHVSSPTGIVFPIKEIIEICRARNIKVMIDGAHAPGMLDLNLNELKPDWYTGNCHKWLFAPKGSAFLWTSKEYQSITHPLTISLEYEHGYEKEFDWTGTKNPASWLATTEAIKFYKEFGNSEIRAYNNKLVNEAADLITEKTDFIRIAKGENTGSIVSFAKIKPTTKEESINYRKQLLNIFRIEVPIFPYRDYLVFRISTQIYNQIDDYGKLIAGITTLNL